MGAIILALCCGFVISYGLVFRGIFRELRNLERELARRDDLLRKYQALPAIRDEDSEREEYRREVRLLEADIDRVWRSAEFSGSFVGWKDRSPFSWLSKRGVALQLGKILPLDLLLEPELAAEVEKARGRIKVVQRKYDHEARWVEQLGDEHTRLEEELRHVSESIRAIRLSLQETKLRAQREILRIKRSVRELVRSCKQAHALGRGARTVKVEDDSDWVRGEDSGEERHATPTRQVS